MRFSPVPAAIVVMAVCAAGCHGSCRRSPGPAFIERRPPEETTVGYRPVETGFDTEPLTPYRRHHPTVGRLRGTGSLSIGKTTRGFLVNGRELPRCGPNHRVMTEQAGRATNFGTDELVAAVLKAADDVAGRFPGSVLPVGNMSRGGGGPLKWSVSHKSGRDADVGFYLVGAAGKQVFQEFMTRIDRSGTTVLSDGVVAAFDAPRNWTLVKSLLNNRNVSVQWLFMADHLKKRLMDYARSRREPASLLARADAAIAQPRGLSHDDHIHVRLYCAADDLLEGCVDSGSNRPWYSGPDPRVARRRSELIRLVRSADPRVRRDAVEVLGYFGDAGCRSAVASRLSDVDPGVRRAAAGSVEWMGLAGMERQVAAAIIDPATPDDVADRLLRVVESSPARSSVLSVSGLLRGAVRTLVVDNGVFVSSFDVGQRASAAGARFD